MLHHQSTGSAAFAATVLGDDQHHRKPTCRSAHPHPPGDQLAEWLHGPPLDGFGLLEDGKELPQDYGLSRTLDAGGDSERIAGRHSASSGVVISTQPPLATFNYGRDILSSRIFCNRLSRRDNSSGNSSPCRSLPYCASSSASVFSAAASSASISCFRRASVSVICL